MKIPLMTYVLGAASTANPRYFAMAGGGVYTATINTARSPAPIAGVISKLYIKTNPALTAGSYTVVLMVNGVASALTATVSSGGSTANDTSNTVTIAAGDLLEWRLTPASTPDALTGLAVTAVFESSVARSAPLFTGHSSGTGAYFMPPTSISVITGEGFGTGTMAVAGDITYMTVRLTTAPGAGITRTYTLRKNGADTGLAVAIADSATSGTATATVSFAAGDEITVGLVNTGGTPAATHGGIGLTWAPTVNGYFPMLAVASSAFATSGTRYVPGSGITPGNNTTELNAVSIAPVDMTVDMMYAEISTAPGAGKSRAFTLRSDATTDRALTATIADSAVDAQDLTHSYSPTAGTLLTVSEVPSGTPAAIATYNRVGMRGFITPLEGAGGRRLLTLGVG